MLAACAESRTEPDYPGPRDQAGHPETCLLRVPVPGRRCYVPAMQCQAAQCGFDARYQCMGSCGRRMCGRHFTFDGPTFFTREYTWTHSRGIDLARLGGDTDLVRNWLSATGAAPECDGCLHGRLDDLYTAGAERVAAIEQHRIDRQSRAREERMQGPARLTELHRRVHSYVRSGGYGNPPSRFGWFLRGWRVRGDEVETQGGFAGSLRVYVPSYVLGTDGLLYPGGKRGARRGVSLQDESMLLALPGFPRQQ